MKGVTMAAFNIEITELLSRVVNIEATNMEEAMKMVSKKYKDEEIVLDYNDFKGYEIVPYVE